MIFNNPAHGTLALVRYLCHADNRDHGAQSKFTGRADMSGARVSKVREDGVLDSGSWCITSNNKELSFVQKNGSKKEKK
jgi:hypothetical protein